MKYLSIFLCFQLLKAYTQLKDHIQNFENIERDPLIKELINMP